MDVDAIWGRKVVRATFISFFLLYTRIYIRQYIDLFMLVCVCVFWIGCDKKIRTFLFFESNQFMILQNVVKSTTHHKTVYY